MENRPQWGTRAGFVLAAIGSAVGLGNIWRFPAVAYENGGGAFFLPYLFALLTAGIPLLILEFTIGQKYRGSAPLSYARMNKKYEWLGWWQVAISFVIATYYAVIIAWAIRFAGFSFSLKWGDDPEGFLFGSFLKLADNPGDVGGIVPGVFIPLVVVWIITLGILFKGIKKGIEIANKIFIPALLILFLIIVVRSVTLEGAAAGLEAFFKPDWGQIANPKVWVAAYGQIFFSLSIAFAIMVTYASYLPKKTDITNNAFITGFANSGVELLAGIGVFAALGFMASQAGVPVSEVVAGGVGLAFVVFPQIISEMPALNGIFGSIFFICLVLAGLSSLISIVETFVAGIEDKFKLSRTKAVLFGGGLAAIVSILFSTNGGLYFLDAADYFINNFGVALAGLVEVIIVAWVLRELKNLQSHANSMSDIRLGSWWKICLGIITPVVLGYMMVQNIVTNIKENYEGYPTSFLLYMGWGVAVLAIILGFVFMAIKWNKSQTLEIPENKEVSQ
ncbi:NSS family neurotransmitter:Na+ symporter [Cytobacillus eiseniae]|uniref:NSS family neurotransmitter:Na+ symporter n=1 Tax=Cytobacillus eiseniae TaxID=762947 RepID=A0ABS4RC02_9BACI|nr:sodium-dependent transporter [Cytobacillus eiseniae]MBP2240432.1 NSS family neurotransmitter:Na+ symporter [Cytobacillus eiseniae]